MLRSLPGALCALVFTSLLLTSVGCGSGKKLTPVEGQVTVGGQALKTGTVTYHPDKTKGNNASFAQLPIGTINESGRYSLSTGATAGAPEGWYKVTVLANAPSDSKDPYAVPKSLIDTANANPETTSLSVEVKAGAAAGSYDLKLNR